MTIIWTILITAILLGVVRLLLDNSGPLPKRSERSPRMKDVR